MFTYICEVLGILKFKFKVSFSFFVGNKKVAVYDHGQADFGQGDGQEPGNLPGVGNGWGYGCEPSHA